MKVMNIDAFVAPERRLLWKGKAYDVQELNLQQFIDNLQAAESLDKEKKQGADAVQAYLELSIKAILKAVPGFPEEDLRAMPVTAMSKVLEFIRGDFDPDAAKSAAPAAAGEGTTQEGAAAEKKPA